MAAFGNAIKARAAMIREAGYLGRGPFIHPRAPGGVQLYTGQMMYNRGDKGQAGDLWKTLGNIGKTIAGVGGKVVSAVVPGVGPIIGGGLTAISQIGSKRSKTAGPGGPIALGQTTGMLPAAGGLVGGMMGGLPGALAGGALGGIANQLVSSSGPDLPGFNNPLTGQQVMAFGQGAPRGYRYNKSRYYIDHPMFPGSEIGQEIEPGTRLVKIRHRNPYNPKAASRAMSRLSALHSGMKTLEKQLAKLAPRRTTRSCAPRPFQRKCK